MNHWFYILLLLFLQIYTGWKYPKRVNRGKFLTRPLIKRFGVKTNLGSSCVRLSQLFGVLVIELSATPFLGQNISFFIYVVGVAALYVDDILTGDDDEFKRRWDLVKNKIKWKMELPKLAPVRGTA